jgi:hypothetical protein
MIPAGRLKKEEPMVVLDSLVHFSIPVSNVATSTRFYTEIVGLKHLQTVAHGTMAFLDAAGVCVILVKRNPAINRVEENHGGMISSSVPTGFTRSCVPAHSSRRERFMAGEVTEMPSR